VISIPPFELKEWAPLFANLPEPVKDTQPRTMEMYDQGRGCILYRTEVPAGPAGRLEASAIHDFGYVFLDGQRIGVTDRRLGNYRIEVPARTKPARLDILVEPMGRVNFGVEVHDRKGIHGPVKFASGEGESKEVTGWSVFNLTLEQGMLERLQYAAPQVHLPGFWRGKFNVATPGDTFLDLRGWGKGVIWVNGHCLARFWNIGPTQTAYLPAPWLHSGDNEIIILDLLGPEKPAVAGLERPILDQLRPQLDFGRGHRAEMVLHLDGAKSVQEGAFAPGSDTQEVRFANPVRGRFFCLESLSAQDGTPNAGIAELGLLDTTGQLYNTEGWKVAYVDSEERTKEDGLAENAIDGQTANYWHTEWSASSPGHPHRLILDLGSPRQISGFRYTPLQGQKVSGRIKDYRIYVGNRLVSPK
jgi:beta-galactosidase